MHTRSQHLHREILLAEPSAPAREMEVLFVHGVFVGAWVWADYMAHLSALGYRCRAVSLRGHGSSDPHPTSVPAGLTDYAHDVAFAVAQSQAPTVIVAHSMGTAVAQAYLRAGGQAAAVALVAPIPPYGLGPASLRMLTMQPQLWTALATATMDGVAQAPPQALLDGLFAQPPERDVVDRLIAGSRDESPLAATQVMGGYPFAPWPVGLPPMAVMGGSEDAFVGAAERLTTAQYYRCPNIELPGLGHALMLERAWDTGAEALAAWLETVA